jgi:hypothetical protein
VVENPRPGSLDWSNFGSIGWAALGIGMITVVVGATEHDMLWGFAAGLVAVAMLAAIRAVNRRYSLPSAVDLIEHTSRAAAMTIAGVLTPIWVIDVIVVGVVRADAGSYAPLGLIMIYAVAGIVAILWVASVLAVMWTSVAVTKSSSDPPLSART